MSDKTFTKENLDTYLKELAKEFRKRCGKSANAEIILIGGAAILANYSFREMTTDIDAVIHASSAIKDAINVIGDRYDLPNGWLNADFMKTSSYSPKLDQFSVHYKSFFGVLSVRTVSNEYLIAMKLRSGRRYKNDLSDIIGILSEHEQTEKPLTFDSIDRAVINLYGGWDSISEDSKAFINNAFANGNFSEIYASVRNEEIDSKSILIDFEEKYPKTANASNVDAILKSLKAKRNK